MSRLAEAQEKARVDATTYDTFPLSAVEFRYEGMDDSYGDRVTKLSDPDVHEMKFGNLCHR